MTPGEPDLRPLHERLDDLRLAQIPTLEEAQERLYAMGVTDGLPVIPPTDDRIVTLLEGCGYDRFLQLPLLPPAFAAPALWDLAANVVMAGGTAAHLPVLIAAIHAFADPAFNLLGIQTTTGSAAPVLIVHGPIASDLGMNGGANCLGQGNRANATIGRALRLILQNVGGAVPGIGDMATLGQPGKYTWCFTENEADSPWEPFHATRGFAANASAVTAVSAAGSVEVVLGSDDPEDLVRRLVPALYAAGAGRGPRGYKQATLLLPPESAQFLHGQGWDRARLARELLTGVERLAAVAGVSPGTPSGNGHAEGAAGEVSPEEVILIVVAGGTGVKSAVLPSWSAETKAITRAVEMP